MRPLKYLFVLTIILPLANLTIAQNLSNYRRRVISCTNDSLKIDSLSIIPESESLFEINGKSISKGSYEIDYLHSKLRWIVKPGADSVEISYRIFPYYFPEKYSHKRLESNDSIAVERFTLEISPNSTATKSIDLAPTGLNKSGTISRGITVGNNQDMILNSNLDLRLSGKLTEDIEILAALSDNNIPLQPEGNTANLQDFDRVFIQLSSKRNKVIFGDYLLKNKPDNYFLRYYKKTQGILFEDNLLFKNNIRMKTGASFSLSKGKYGRNAFNGKEGHQGPYKLTGNDSEMQITVIAGTEKVHINGNLLKRGEHNDYIINYNIGEIIFTNNKIISNYDRIIIEFQYADRNYKRSIFHISNGYNQDNWEINVNFYSAQDNKSKTLFGEMDSLEKAVIKNVGDSLENAIISGEDSIGYDSTLIMYKKIDTFGFKNVYVHSSNPDSAHYHVKFTYVGIGKGNYKQMGSSINGKIMEWVQPINNISQGEYEPIKKIISPKKQQLFTLGGKYNFNDKSSVGFEIGISNVDKNTLSDKNDEDNIGIAAKVFINRTFDIDKNKEWKIFSQLDYEFKDSDFRPNERYRNVEFERSWDKQISNPDNISLNQKENLANLALKLSKNKQFSFNNISSSYIKENGFSGIANNSDLFWKIGSFQFIGNNKISEIKSNLSPAYQSDKDFKIHSFTILKDFELFKIGGNIHYEVNEHREHSSDSLEMMSNKHNEWKIFIKNHDTLKNNMEISFSQRNDFLPLDNNFKFITQSNNLSLKTDLIKKSGKHLKCLIKYTNFKSEDSNYFNYQSKNTFLSTIEGNFRIMNFIKSSTYYQIGSGKEQKKEFYYFKVDKGKGIYIFNDYNRDGIEELDEFEVTNFQDEANYIRIIIPTNKYVSAIFNEFQQNLLFSAPHSWKQKNKVNKFIGRFSDQAKFRITRKLLDNKTVHQYNPFLLNIEDTSLLTINSNIRNSIFFNRNNPQFGVELSLLENKYKILLINGFDTRLKKEVYLKLRMKLNPIVILYPEYLIGEKSNYVEFSPSRDYHIYYKYLRSKVTFQNSVRFRTSIEYTNKDYENNFKNLNARHDKIGLEATYSILTKGIVKATFSWIKVNYNGIVNSPVAYEILEGLKTGINYQWGIFTSYQFQNNLIINLNYNGRKPEGNQPIHIGSVKIRYLF